MRGPRSGQRWAFNKRKLIGRKGNPMLERWRVIQTPLFGIYVHFIYREDLDPTPHDHPWSFWSLVLRGSYVEARYRDAARRGVGYGEPIAYWDAGFRRRLHHFPLADAHRITAVAPGTITLVLVGRAQRRWGFYGPDGTWTYWQDAEQMRPTEGVTG